MVISVLLSCKLSSFPKKDSILKYTNFILNICSIIFDLMYKIF